MSWQLIETAPEDGTYILGWGDEMMPRAISWFLGDWSGECEGLLYPTHWMPLPEPPSE